MRKILLALFLWPAILFAQLSDDFEDGDIADWTESSFGRWAASASNSLNGNYSLHHVFDNPSGDRDQISLKLPVFELDQDTTYWKFRLRHGYNPSSSNNWCVFLLSDEASAEMHPSGAANGYALGVNYSGSDDTLKLWKITSGSASEILNTSVDWQEDIGTSKAPAFKIIRTETGKWQVFFNADGDFDNLNLIGEGSDNSYLANNYFGIYYEYSSSQDQKLWIDDIEINGKVYVDNDFPIVDTLKVISSSQLRMEFNETLDSAIAVDRLQYIVDGGIGNPDSVGLDENKKTVELFLGQALSNGEYYHLTLQNIEDEAGNAMNDTIIQFLYYVPQPFDVAINEIMADPTPAVDLPGYEYIEIKNTTDFNIDLQGWKLKIGDNLDDFPAYVLDSSGYLILCDQGEGSHFDSYGKVIEIPYSYITDGGKSIAILDADDVIIDSINFTKDWYQDREKEDGGWSLERIDPQNTCSTLSNWKASIDSKGGTPGTENSVYASNLDNFPPQPVSVEIVSGTQLKVIFDEAIIELALTKESNYLLNHGLGSPATIETNDDLTEVDLVFSNAFPLETELILTIENMEDECGNINDLLEFKFTYYVAKPYDVVINEIMANPTPAVDLPEYEYIEIKNTTEFNINLKGWKLKMGDNLDDFPAYVLDSSGYLILCDQGEGSHFDSYGDVIEIPYSYITDGGKSIAILDADDVIIDSIYFTKDWYQDLEKEDGGWSLERIDPQNTCSTLSNWKASIDSKGGTPGTENSVYASNLDNFPPQLVSVEIVSGTQLKVIFNEAIIESALTKESNYSINRGLGNPATIESNSDLTEVNLVFSNSFPQETDLILSIENMEDECGNISEISEHRFIYYDAKIYDVVISEIMADPEPAFFLPEFEYIELYNITEHDISLKGWKLSVGSSVRTISNGTIGTRDYLILCDEEAASYFQDYGKVLSFSSFPSLGNSQETLTLKKSDDKMISNVLYTNEWYQDDYKADGGWSLEQVDPMNPCGEENNWIASESEIGGTPGKENSVQDNNPDLEAPELERIVVIDNTTIKLFFNESVDSLSAMHTHIYGVDRGIGSPNTVHLDQPDYKSLKLNFDTSFDLSTIYTLEITGELTDCSGNEIVNNNSAKFAIPEIPEESDLVINEILFNPLPGGYDFVEIYNRSKKTIDLKDVLIASYDDEKTDFTEIRTINSDGFLIFPADYMVLTENMESVQVHYITANPNRFIELVDLPNYSNDKGRVVLLDKWQNVIDNLAYNEDMHFDLLATTEGVSLERINFDRETSDKTNWHSASEIAGFATPGFENSQFMGLVETKDQISIHPEIISPDNDGFEDVANINLSFEKPGYVANVKIYDAKGRLTRYLANNQLLGVNDVITWDGLDENNKKAPVGIYVVFIEVFDLEGNVKQYKKPVVVAARY